MLSLNTLQAVQSSKEFDPDAANVDAATLSRAFDKALRLLSNVNLYGASLAQVVNRIVRDYTNTSTRKISTGRVNEAWTTVKVTKIAPRLEYLMEDALQDNPIAEDVRFRFETSLGEYKNEFLVAERKMFHDKHQWMPPEGRLELYYIPLIEEAVDLVFRVYRLYQIEDRTRADFRISADRHEVSVMIVQTAHALAEGCLANLLNDFSRRSLDRSKAIIAEIEKAHSKMFVVTRAAKGEGVEKSGREREIDRTQLLLVNEAFATKLSEQKKLELEWANHNIGSYTKHAVIGAINTASSAVSALGNTSNYLTDKLLDLAIGNVEGPRGNPRSADSDDDEDEDEAAEYSGPSTPQMVVGKIENVNWNYCEPEPSSASAVSGSALVNLKYDTLKQIPSPPNSPSPVREKNSEHLKQG